MINSPHYNCKEGLGWMQDLQGVLAAASSAADEFEAISQVRAWAKPNHVTDRAILSAAQALYPELLGDDMQADRFGSWQELLDEIASVLWTKEPYCASDGNDEDDEDDEEEEEEEDEESNKERSYDQCTGGKKRQLDHE